MKKKILITGANGYLGARLALLLLKDYDVIAHCYPKIPKDKVWLNKMASVTKGDLRKPDVIEALTKNDIHTIIHLVSLDHHQSEDNPNFVSSVNVLPTWNLLDAFSKKESLKTFIYFSTFQVYGKVPMTEISEDFKPSPQNTYGLTHLMSENICNLYNNKTKINSINVRLSNSYGSPVFEENNCWWLVINDLCKTAYHKKKIMLLSDGSPQRDFIHSSDVYEAINILINTKKNNESNNTYHISSGETYTILELAHIVKSAYQKRYNRDIQISLPDGSVSINSDKFLKKDRYLISNSKLKSIGFSPRTDLETGIEKTFIYLEKQKVNEN
jgi:UDP-glucose 4-epimerase